MNRLLDNPLLLLLILAWSIFWKGLALWRAAKDNQRNWFIALLIINTVGILEIIYLLQFAKDKKFLKQFFARIFKSD
jgi:hypothetical protein